MAAGPPPAAIFFALALMGSAVQRGAMAERPSPRRGPVGVLAVFFVIVAGVMVLAPNLVGAWLGGLIGEIWATALAAITALLSGLFGG